MGYNLPINGVSWGYNPLTNHLLSSWDIQVVDIWLVVFHQPILTKYATVKWADIFPNFRGEHKTLKKKTPPKYKMPGTLNNQFLDGNCDFHPFFHVKIWLVHHPIDSEP